MLKWIVKNRDFKDFESRLFPHHKATNSSGLSGFGWRSNFHLPRAPASRDKLTPQSSVEKTKCFPTDWFNTILHLSTFNGPPTGCNNLSCLVPSISSVPRAHSNPRTCLQSLGPEVFLPGETTSPGFWGPFSWLPPALSPHIPQIRALYPPCLMVWLGYRCPEHP